MALSTLVKQPAESRLYDFDFSNLLVGGATLVSGETVSQAVVTGTDTLILSGVVRASPLVQARISGGTNGAKHKLTARCVDSLGNTLEVEGFLKIKDI